ncbi:MAG: hypothetical protein QM736_11230, partial [Vicinamibacterales bacterium]
MLLQFLVEAISLSLLGGGIGIALGFGLAEGMSRWMSWPAKVPANAVGMAFGFAAAVGVFFGFYPAREGRAARCCSDSSCFPINLSKTTNEGQQ